MSLILMSARARHRRLTQTGSGESEATRLDSDEDLDADLLGVESATKSEHEIELLMRRAVALPGLRRFESQAYLTCFH